MPLLPDGAGQRLQARVIGKIPHHGMAAREIDGVEQRWIDLVWPLRVGQQGHALRIVQPRLCRGIEQGPFEGARFERRQPAFGADDDLLVALCFEVVPGMR